MDRARRATFSTQPTQHTRSDQSPSALRVGASTAFAAVTPGIVTTINNVNMTVCNELNRNGYSEIFNKINQEGVGLASVNAGATTLFVGGGGLNRAFGATLKSTRGFKEYHTQLQQYGAPKCEAPPQSISGVAHSYRLPPTKSAKDVFIHRLTGDALKHPYNQASNKHMIYVVPPERGLYQGDDEFLEAVQDTAQHLIRTVRAYNAQAASQDKITTVRMGAFSAGGYRGEVDPRDVMQRIISGVVQELDNSDNQDLQTIEYAQEFQDLLQGGGAAAGAVAPTARAQMGRSRRTPTRTSGPRIAVPFPTTQRPAARDLQRQTRNTYGSLTVKQLQELLRASFHHSYTDSVTQGQIKANFTQFEARHIKVNNEAGQLDEVKTRENRNQFRQAICTLIDEKNQTTGLRAAYDNIQEQSDKGGIFDQATCKALTQEFITQVARLDPSKMSRGARTATKPAVSAATSAASRQDRAIKRKIDSAIASASGFIPFSTSTERGQERGPDRAMRRKLCQNLQRTCADDSGRWHDGQIMACLGQGIRLGAAHYQQDPRNPSQITITTPQEQTTIDTAGFQLAAAGDIEDAHVSEYMQSMREKFNAPGTTRTNAVPNHYVAEGIARRGEVYIQYDYNDANPAIADSATTISPQERKQDILWACWPDGKYGMDAGAYGDRTARVLTAIDKLHEPGEALLLLEPKAFLHGRGDSEIGQQQSLAWARAVQAHAAANPTKQYIINSQYDFGLPNVTSAAGKDSLSIAAELKAVGQACVTMVTGDQVGHIGNGAKSKRSANNAFDERLARLAPSYVWGFVLDQQQGHVMDCLNTGDWGVRPASTAMASRVQTTGAAARPFRRMPGELQDVDRGTGKAFHQIMPSGEVMAEIVQNLSSNEIDISSLEGAVEGSGSLKGLTIEKTRDGSGVILKDVDQGAELHLTLRDDFSPYHHHMNGNEILKRIRSQKDSHPYVKAARTPRSTSVRSVSGGRRAAQALLQANQIISDPQFRTLSPQTQTLFATLVDVPVGDRVGGLRYNQLQDKFFGKDKERGTNFVQPIFITPQTSANHSAIRETAPTDSDIAILKEIGYPEFLKTVLPEMLAHWGFQIDVKGNVSSLQGIQFINKAGDHNSLRLTRVLECLALFCGSDRYLNQVFGTLSEHVMALGEDERSERGVKDSYDNFWKEHLHSEVRIRATTRPVTRPEAGGAAQATTRSAFAQVRGGGAPTASSASRSTEWRVATGQRGPSGGGKSTFEQARHNSRTRGAQATTSSPFEQVRGGGGASKFQLGRSRSRTRGVQDKRSSVSAPTSSMGGGRAAQATTRSALARAQDGVASTERSRHAAQVTTRDAQASQEISRIERFEQNQIEMGQRLLDEYNSGNYAAITGSSGHVPFDWGVFPCQTRNSQYRHLNIQVGDALYAQLASNPGYKNNYVKLLEAYITAVEQTAGGTVRYFIRLEKCLQSLNGMTQGYSNGLAQELKDTGLARRLRRIVDNSYTDPPLIVRQDSTHIHYQADLDAFIAFTDGT
ncbi:MAG: hypothetical protein VW378_04180 [bacterium]